MLSLCLWREARGEGSEGQTAVACVIRNRVIKNSTNYYAEIVKPWQFSSITAKGDPQLGLFPSAFDKQWEQCQEIAQNVIFGQIQDVTGGATLYWNPKGIESNHTFTTLMGSTVAFPDSWNPHKVSETVQIGDHIFLKELA